MPGAQMLLKSVHACEATQALLAPQTQAVALTVMPLVPAVEMEIPLANLTATWLLQDLVTLININVFFQSFLGMRVGGPTVGFLHMQAKQ